jgi:uncharacterized small protein (DUF1192 family)
MTNIEELEERIISLEEKIEELETKIEDNSLFSTI